jgi:N-acetylmuramoyl-L-alanine amidase
MIRTFHFAAAATAIAFAVLFSCGAVQNARAFNTVIIDAGHGGHDLGASDSLVYEKHINLDVARRLDIALRKLGYRTVMTRNDDNFIPLDTRATMANRHRKAIFVSVHFNSSYKTKVSGIETYYRSSTGQKLAALVQNELIRSIGSPNRGVKTANFLVLKKTRHPAILIEGGFISNKTERNAMMDPRFRQAVVDSVARAIVNFDRRY